MKYGLCFAGILWLVSCSSIQIVNTNHEKLLFSSIKSNYQVTDVHNYGCEKIDISVIKHILQTGDLLTEKEIQRSYSLTGCTVKGTVKINGRKVDFSFDYGGILWLGNGMILGCGDRCCEEDYPYCSWDQVKDK